MHQQQTAFENIVGKGEIAHNEQFLLFPQCFQLNQITVSPFVHIFDIIFLFAVELEEPRICISGKRVNKISSQQLTHDGSYMCVYVFYHTTFEKLLSKGDGACKTISLFVLICYSDNTLGCTRKRRLHYKHALSQVFEKEIYCICRKYQQMSTFCYMCIFGMSKAYSVS